MSADADLALRIVEAGRRRVAARLHTAFDNQIAADVELGAVAPDVVDELVSEATDRAGAALWRIALAEGGASELGITLSQALAHPAVATAAELVGVGDVAGVPAPQPAAPAPEYATTPENETAPEYATASEPARIPETAPVPQSAPAPEPAPVSEPAPAPAPEPVPAATAPSDSDVIRLAAVHGGGIDSLQAGDDDVELRLSDAGLDVLRRSSATALGRLNWAELASAELEEGRRRRGRRRAATLQVRTARGQASFELPELDDATAERTKALLARLRADGVLGE